MENKEMINWLKSGDPVIAYLTNTYLLEQKQEKSNVGYIEKYLELYNTETNEWGGGIYSPLWISSHYTLLELKYMEIDSNHPYYQQAALKLLDELWFNQGKVTSRRYQDMCMSAMLLSIISYGKIESSKTFEIIDYILDHQMTDGGWNCAWDSSSSKSVKSSFHTTISVLEAFNDYIKCGCSYRVDDIEQSVVVAEEYLLSRKLLYSLSRNKIADPEFAKFHYPFRYKYDCFRALEYFSDKNHLYDPRMEEALLLLQEQINKGPISTGKQYSGKIHFRLERTKYGRFNTLRALKILKKYKPNVFKLFLES